LDAYKVLGIGQNATRDNITQAYDRLILASPTEECSQVPASPPTTTQPPSPPPK